MNDTERRLYLSPAEYIDSDHPDIQRLALDLAASASGPRDTVRAIYDIVRDRIRYNPYVDYADLDTYRASAVLRTETGYCVGKAALFAALCRAAGYPARIGLADVRNHLSTGRLLDLVGTDVFAYHGFGEIFLDGRWLKVSPTFNASLCAKLGVSPLAFDGGGDALLQPFDDEGRTFMEYLLQRGSYFDVPAKFVVAEMQRLYPVLCRPGGLGGSTMEEEAAAQSV